MRASAILLAALLLQDSAITEARGLKYYDGSDADDRKHRLDLYLPKDAKKAPVVMWIHGGAWKTGDRAIYAEVGRRFAEEGIGFAAISYRLTPQVKHPGHIEDCARAFAWLHARVSEHGGDPDRLFVMGQSAGGHLSALLALDPKYLKAHKVPEGAIKAAIPMSGVYSIPALPAETKGFMAIFPTAFGTDREVCRDASPVTHVKNCTFPMLVVTETDDNYLVRPSLKLLEAAVTQGGVKGVEFADATNRNHISIVIGLAKKGDEVRARIVDFIKKRCQELDKP